VFIGTPASAQQPATVLILPFTIHSQEDLSYLKKGIQEMLSTRLTVPEKVVPVDRDKAQPVIASAGDAINDSTAARLGAQAGADYVAFGSLTMIGNSISTDARFVEVSSGKTLVTYANTGDSAGQAISHINLFAMQVTDEVFGQKNSVYQPPAATTGAGAGQASYRQHPDKMWKEEASKQEYTFMSPDSGHKVPFKIWKSRNIPYYIRGLAMGDVDGDGHIEVVFITSNRVMIYRLKDRQFAQLANIRSDNNHILLGVDVADINANGKAEIFVTGHKAQSMNDNLQINRLRSYVLEWDGTRFAPIAEEMEWYLRVVKDPVVGPILAGQKRGIDVIFAPGITQLVWSNNTYKPVQELDLPRKVDVFSFTYGDIKQDGDKYLIWLSRSGMLSVSNPNGGVEWSSSDDYVGGDVYLLEPRDPFGSNRPNSNISRQKEVRYYLSPRILVDDLDNDENPEVYIFSNKDYAGKALPDVRVFKNGQIDALFWDQIGLYNLWRTRRMKGHISDMAIADIDGDGQKELVFANVVDIPSAINLEQGKSVIYAWKPKKGEAAPAN
jgi:TolB-like protein